MTETEVGDAGADSRIQRFRKVFVQDPTLVEIRATIDTLHRTGRGTTHSQCMGLFGPSGSGKTRLVHHYERSFMKTTPEPSYMQGGIEIRTLPILFVECPARATVKGMAETLLAALGDPRPSRGSQQEMTQRVLHALRVRRVSLIVMDEFQHLVGRARGHDSAYETADWIKSLLNANLCPILLVGTESAASILKVNEQLQRRTLAVHRVLPYSVVNPTDFEVFQQMLAGLEEALGLGLPSGLADDDLARRIHAATDGLIGRITGLLDRALLLAIQRRENSITRQTLRDVYNRTVNIGRIEENPFATDVPGPAGRLPAPEDGSRVLRGQGRGDRQPRAKDIMA